MDNEGWNIEQKQEKTCEARIIGEGQSQPIKPVIRNGPVIAKVPIVISQMRVHINIESKICLDRHSFGIQSFTRKIYITNCNLMDLGNKKYGKLYIKGYIRENIEYLDAECVNKGDTSSSIRCMIVRIPFDCSAKVCYSTIPRIKTVNQLIPVELYSSGGVQRRYTASSYLQYRGFDFDVKIGKNQCQGLICEMEDADVQQIEIIEEIIQDENINLRKNVFDTFTEQMIVSLEITLLQRQLVNISNYPAY